MNWITSSWTVIHGCCKRCLFSFTVLHVLKNFAALLLLDTLPGQHLNKVCKRSTLLIKFACTSRSVTSMLSLGVRMKPHAWIQGKKQITKCLTLSSRRNNIKHIEQNKRHLKKIFWLFVSNHPGFVFFIYILFYIYIGLGLFFSFLLRNKETG